MNCKMVCRVLTLLSPLTRNLGSTSIRKRLCTSRASIDCAIRASRCSRRGSARPTSYRRAGGARVRLARSPCLCQRYVSSCDMCQRVRLVNHLPCGSLRQPPIPTANWTSIRIDFLYKIPPSNHFTTVIVFVDRRFKRAHFLPCSNDLDAFDFAQIFREGVFRLYGLPQQIITDRRIQFVDQFFSRLCEILYITHSSSTSFHRRTNGQAERTIQTLEAYLRCCCYCTRDDWHTWLPMAEFAYNNLTNTATGRSPFEADGVIAPRFNFLFDSLKDNTVADRLVACRKQVQDDIDGALALSQIPQLLQPTDSSSPSSHCWATSNATARQYSDHATNIQARLHASRTFQNHGSQRKQCYS